MRFAELLDVVIGVPQSPRVLRRSSEPEGRVALNKRERAAVGYCLVRPLVSLIELALLVPLLGIPLTVAAGLVAGWSGWVFPVSDVVSTGCLYVTVNIGRYDDTRLSDVLTDHDSKSL